MRAANILARLICTRACGSSTVAVGNGVRNYCCLPLFCAAGPISLLKAMYETSRPAMAETPTQRMTTRSKLTVRPMKMPGKRYVSKEATVA